MEIQYKDNIILSTLVNEGSKRKFTLMNEDYITLKFSLSDPIFFPIGSKTTDGLFEVTGKQDPKYNESTGGWDYELKMEAYYLKWKNKIFKFTPDYGGQESAWSLTSTLSTFLSLFLKNLTALGYTFNGKPFEFVIDDSVEDSSQVLSFDNTNLIDGLTAMAEAWGCEWWMTDNIIHFGRCEFGTAVDFEVGKNVESMTSTDSKTDYATRIYAFGSTKNIPLNYRQADESMVVSGVVTTRLMLPEGTPYVDAYEGMTQEEAVEAIVIFEDVYPRTETEVTQIETYTDNVEEEDGTITEETFYRIHTDGLWFSEDYRIDGTDLNIKFTSGKLNGMTFTAMFNPEGLPEEINGAPNAAAQFFELVVNETYGRKLPDDTLHPEVGDTFVLDGWNTDYISNLGLMDKAEKELLQRAQEYVEQTKTDPKTYSCKMMSDYMYGLDEEGNPNPDYGRTFEAGQRVNLVSKAFFKEGQRESRVIGFEYDLDKPYDSPTLTIGETATYSRLGELQEQIEEVTLNGQTYSGVAGSGVYIIGTNDTTSPSNQNVYSALRSKQDFLSKKEDDTANGKITFNKGLEVGQFESGTSGGYWGIDTSNNKTTIETDNLYVRYKAFFESLEVVNVASLGGKMILTAGGSAKLSYAVKHGEETILAKMLLEDRGLLKTEGWGDIILEQLEELEPIPEGVWRCFFLAEQDGQEVENRFEAGDQIISKDFNITKPGEYNQVTNHYYWRLCVNKSTNVVTLADLGYHWVDLSMSDCDTGSVDPCKGDVIAQLGNRIGGNKERQNAIVMTSVDDFAPQICLYSGITSFSLDERNMVDIGVDDNEQAFLKVFGKFYVGTRPKYNEDGSVDETDETYVKFQDGKVSIKAKIEATSTVGDRTLENYVNGISDEKAQEVQDALDENVKSINESLTDTNNNVSGLKNFTDSAFADGIVDRSEAQTIIGYLKTIETSFQDAQNSYEEIKGNEFLGSEEKKALETAYTAFSTAKDELVAEINKIVDKGLVDDDDRSNMSQKYTNFNNKFGTFKNKLNAAVNAITVALNDKITELGADITKLDYIKKALAESTTFTGGLVLSTLISLGYDNSNFSTQTSWAGLSGAYDTTKIGNGIAFWAGGDMIDKFDYYDYSTGTFNVPEGKRVAASLDRMDGTGYRANGNLWWDADGNVHADPLSFFVGPTQVGKLLAAFNVTDDTIYPQLPFGDTSFQGVDGIKIGDGYLKWDSERNALYVVGKDKDGNEQAINFYTHGEVIAGGGDSDDDGGGNVSFNLLTSWTQDYDTTYALGAALAIELHNSLNTLSTKVENIKTNVGVSVNNGSVVYPNDNDVIALTVDEYTPTAATSGALGCIKIGYTTSAANRKYAVELDSSNKAFVNVPWTDTTYTLSAATSSALGGIKIGYTESGRNYAVKLDSSNKAYVNVPWTDTTYTSLKNPYSLKFDGDSAKSYDGSSEVKVTAAMVGALASDGKAKSAGTADSATTAGQLTNSHTFWGQSFNGTQDVSGALSSVTTISASGNITTSGEVTAGSDIRYKDIQHDCSLPLASIAGAPLFNFKWKGERDDGREHIGTSAQYWQNIAPEFVSGDEDFLQLNYGALGVAMGISNARAIQSVHEQMIEMARSLQRLTEENKRLSAELDYIRKGGQR